MTTTKSKKKTKKIESKKSMPKLDHHMMREFSNLVSPSKKDKIKTAEGRGSISFRGYNIFLGSFLN